MCPEAGVSYRATHYTQLACSVWIVLPANLYILSRYQNEQVINGVVTRVYGNRL